MKIPAFLESEECENLDRGFLGDNTKYSAGYSRQHIYNAL